jgi:hypothetical protein
MKRTSALLLSLLVIANVATIAPAQATPWEALKNAAAKTGTFIKKGVKSVATGIKDNIISPLGIALGVVGANVAINEAVLGAILLKLSAITPAHVYMISEALELNPKTADLLASTFGHPELFKGAGYTLVALSLPTLLLSLQGIKSGVQSLQKANVTHSDAAQHD